MTIRVPALKGFTDTVRNPHGLRMTTDTGDPNLAWKVVPIDSPADDDDHVGDSSADDDEHVGDSSDDDDEHVGDS